MLTFFLETASFFIFVNHHPSSNAFDWKITIPRAQEATQSIRRTSAQMYSAQLIAHAGTWFKSAFPRVQFPSLRINVNFWLCKTENVLISIDIRWLMAAFYSFDVFTCQSWTPYPCKYLHRYTCKIRSKRVSTFNDINIFSNSFITLKLYNDTWNRISVLSNLKDTDYKIIKHNNLVIIRL